MDLNLITKTFRENGKIAIKEGNGLIVTLLRPELWGSEMGHDWTYLLFDLFQIRSICEPYSEVSLDIVEFATKPTIYQSPANKLLSKGPVIDGLVRFSVIREPEWNKLLLQHAQPDWQLAYIPDPSLSPLELRWALALELGLKHSGNIEPPQLLQLLQNPPP